MARAEFWTGVPGLVVVLLVELAACLELVLICPIRRFNAALYCRLATLCMDSATVGFAGIVMRLWSGINVRLTTDRVDGLSDAESRLAGEMDSDGCAIIISNHLRMSDGFLIASLCASRKREISRLCWVSWIGTLTNPHTLMMWLRGNPFISAGPSAVKKVYDTFKRVGHGKAKEYNSVVFFPEGALRTDDMYVKSKAFADKEGLKCPKRSLLPRAKTFEAAVELLPDATIYDLTCAYTDADMQSGLRLDAMVDFFRFSTKRNYHMHIQKFPASAASADPHNWLIERYVAKDDLLEAFARDGKFPGVELPPATLPWSIVLPRLATCLVILWALRFLLGYLL